MSAKVTFRIDKNGNVNLEVDGVTGQKCSDISAPFESALGLVDDVQQKPEWVENLDGLEVNIEE